METGFRVTSASTESYIAILEGEKVEAMLMRRAITLCDMYYCNRLVIDSALYDSFTDSQFKAHLPPTHNVVAMSAIYTAMSTLCLEFTASTRQTEILYVIIGRLSDYMKTMHANYQPRRVYRRV